MKRTVICEYVGIGHPDKAADQISVALLAAFLEKDPNTLLVSTPMTQKSTVSSSKN